MYTVEPMGGSSDAATAALMLMGMPAMLRNHVIHEGRPAGVMS